MSNPLAIFFYQRPTINSWLSWMWRRRLRRRSWQRRRRRNGVLTIWNLLHVKHKVARCSVRKESISIYISRADVQRISWQLLTVYQTCACPRKSAAPSRRTFFFVKFVTGWFFHSLAFSFLVHSIDECISTSFYNRHLQTNKHNCNWYLQHSTKYLM